MEKKKRNIHDLDPIERDMIYFDVKTKEELQQIYDAETVGWEQHLMDNLEEAIKQGEEPPRSRVKWFLEYTYKVEIPRAVREYIIKCLDVKSDKTRGKVGKQPHSILDSYFAAPMDVFSFFADDNEFDSRNEFIRHKYNKLRKEGYKKKDAIKKIGVDYKYLFKPKDDVSFYGTICQVIYRAKKT
jgi:hypothetical protein